jgi:hypothetical protein
MPASLPRAIPPFLPGPLLSAPTTAFYILARYLPLFLESLSGKALPALPYHMHPSLVALQIAILTASLSVAVARLAPRLPVTDV